MGFLKDEDKEKLKEIFKVLQDDVKLIMFTQEHECEFCKITREILEETTSLSDKITLEVFDFVADAELAKSYGVDKIPAIVLRRSKDHGIRFFGIPSGYEFTTLIEDIIDVSRNEPELTPETMEALSPVNYPVHIQVFVSPTCPYCPAAVRTAHKLALAFDNIQSDMVETSEFPHLVNKYDVQGVPAIIINENTQLVGAQPEEQFVKAILEGAEKNMT